MINKVTLIGNLGRDPEVRHLENGSVVAKLAVATNESYRDKTGEWKTLTEWHNVILWRALAERAERDLKKGSLVYIEGKLTTRKWMDKDNNERYTTEVSAYTFRLLEKRETANTFAGNFPSAADEYTSGSGTSTSTAQTNTNTIAATVVSSDVPAEEDDLPF